MKPIKFLFSLLMTLFFVGATYSLAGPVPAGILFTGIVAGSTNANLSKIIQQNAITPEVWVNYIVENLFKNNEFLMHSVDESQYVIGNTVVHIPQAGTPSGVKKNRAQVPATITRRKDIDITYVLDEFTTDPRYIPNADKVELSYDKMDSCMGEDMAYLQQIVCEAMLYNWKPKYYIKCSGTKSANYLLHGTGVRTYLTVADFAKAKSIFNKWNIPKSDRYVILNTEMFDQLCAEVRAASVANSNLSAVYDPVSGDLRKLESFDIIVRSTVLLASNSTLSAVTGTQYYEWTSSDLLYSSEDYEDIVNGDTSPANEACTVGLFWHKSAVARAMGSTETFQDTGNPTYYGDIYSFLQRLGGRARRNDGKGVLGLIQEYAES